jgi:hypothetical protein
MAGEVKGKQENGVGIQQVSHYCGTIYRVHQKNVYTLYERKLYVV